MNQETLLRWIGFGAFFLLMGAIGFGMAIIKFLEAPVVKAEPQTLTCRQLIDQGYGDNAHVLITDFKLLTDDTVIEYKEISRKTWERVWLPMVPGDQPDDSSSFQVVLASNDVHNPRELAKLNVQPTIQGVVAVVFTSLGDEEQQLLRERFPETDFDKCLIVNRVETGSTPDPMGLGLMCSVFSLVFLALGAIICFIGVRRAKRLHPTA